MTFPETLKVIEEKLDKMSRKREATIEGEMPALPDVPAAKRGDEAASLIKTSREEIEL